MLDIMLPKINGFQILKTIRAERRTTPILMLTARDAPQDTIGGLNLGADDYLTKPFHVDVFVAVCARSLAAVRSRSSPTLTLAASL